MTVKWHCGPVVKACAEEAGRFLFKPQICHLVPGPRRDIGDGIVLMSGQRKMTPPKKSSMTPSKSWILVPVNTPALPKKMPLLCSLLPTITPSVG